MKIMNYIVIKTKKIGKFKIESPINFWVDEFVCLRSKMFAFKCGHERKNKKKELVNFIRKIIILRKIKNVLMEKNMKKNVIKIF